MTHLLEHKFVEQRLAQSGDMKQQKEQQQQQQQEDDDDDEFI